MPYRKFSKKRSYRRLSKKTPNRSRVTPTFSRKVKAILNREIETKTAYISSGVRQPLAFTSASAGYNGTTNQDQGPGFTAYLPWVWDGTPVVAQGTGQSQRVGQNLELKGSYAKVLIGQTAVSSGTNYLVEFYIAYHRLNPNTAPVASNFASFLYSPSASTSTYYDSSTAALAMAPVNEDSWKVQYHKRCYIGNATGGVQFETKDGDYHSRYELTIPLKKFLPRKLDFLTTSSTPTNTHGPYFIFFLRSMNDLVTVNNNGNQPWAQVSCVYKFKDA